MWNHYQDAIDEAAKTTNCTEGWHNSLRSLLLASHPSMWTLFCGLQKDMAIQKLTLMNAETANNDRPKMKYKRLAERLSAKVRNYPEQEDKLKYLRAVAHMT
jgi:hypothetical protein